MGPRLGSSAAAFAVCSSSERAFPADHWRHRPYKVARNDLRTTHPFSILSSFRFYHTRLLEISTDFSRIPSKRYRDDEIEKSTVRVPTVLSLLCLHRACICDTNTTDPTTNRKRLYAPAKCQSHSVCKVRNTIGFVRDAHERTSDSYAASISIEHFRLLKFATRRRRFLFFGSCF